jgi:hypothetical protein
MNRIFSYGCTVLFVLSSLLRCLFTPTEDDLLLRGIMNTSEASWEQVKTFYLPSKEAQLLQFRYSQMTSISALEDNNFKR